MSHHKIRKPTNREDLTHKFIGSAFLHLAFFNHSISISITLISFLLFVSWIYQRKVLKHRITDYPYSFLGSVNRTQYPFISKILFLYALNSSLGLHLKISIDEHNVAPHTTIKKVMLDLA